MLHHDTGWPTEHQGVPGHAPTMTHHKVQSPAKKGLLLSRGLLGLPGQRCAVADPSQVSPRLPMAGGGGPAPPWAWVSSVKCGIALPSSPGGRDGEMSLPCWEAGASGAVSTRNGTAGPEEHRQVRTEVGWYRQGQRSTVRRSERKWDGTAGQKEHRAQDRTEVEGVFTHREATVRRVHKLQD